VKLELRYGDSTQPVEIPDRNLLGILRPNDCCPFHDSDAALRRAATGVRDFIGTSPRVLVLVNDYTRPTPNEAVLTMLEPVLADCDARYLVCTGTHRPPTDAEFNQVFGKSFYERRRDRIAVHDCRNQSRLFFLGKTRFGTEVRLNKELLWADKIITINSIEPHYFAGFTGGRKGFLPGVAAYDSVTQNHNMVTRPGSATFSLEGNPVHEDMTEAARMIPRPVFSIQLVQDRNHNLLSVRSGDLFRSFADAVSDAYKVFAVPVKEKADVVLSVLGPPYDINFYQSQRAVEFARLAFSNPAVQITVSACRDGTGNDGFIQAFQGCSRPSDVLASTRHSSLLTPHSSALLGWHKSARLAQIMETTELYTVMGIDDAVVKSVFMRPFHSIQEAVDLALERLGHDAKAYVIPDAASVVPVLGA